MACKTACFPPSERILSINIKGTDDLEVPEQDENTEDDGSERKSEFGQGSRRVKHNKHVLYFTPAAENKPTTT